MQQPGKTATTKRTLAAVAIATLWLAGGMLAADAPAPTDGKAAQSAANSPNPRIGCWQAQGNPTNAIRFTADAWLADENGRLYGGKVVEWKEGAVDVICEGRKVEFGCRAENGALFLKRGAEAAEVKFKAIAEVPRKLKIMPFCFGEAGVVKPERVKEIVDDFARRSKERRDAEDTAAIKKLTAELGWLDAARFGAETADVAFLIVQHSGDVPLEIAALAEIERDVNAGRISGQGFALLYDRLHLDLGGKQRYGTQAGMGSDGLMLLPLENPDDPEKIEEWRRKAGMQPLVEYLATLEQVYGRKMKIPWEKYRARMLDLQPQMLEQRAIGLMRLREYAKAESLLQQVVQSKPEQSGSYYNLACVQALLGRTNEAFANLNKAIANGFTDVNHIGSDPDLEGLRDDPRFVAALDTAGKFDMQLPPPPTNLVARPPKGGVALIEETNMTRDPRAGCLRVAFDFTARLDPATEIIKEKSYGRAGDLLRQWQKEGTAAGLYGVLYDNQDGHHSELDCAQFPQLNRVEYTAAALRKVNMPIIFTTPTLGNNSSAITDGPYWRSIPRDAHDNVAHIVFQHRQYVNNHLYCFPCVSDHTPGRNGKGGGYGDVYPANTPYVIATQGASGSDIPFITAAVATIAAFQPATQQKLIQGGMLMPAIQMILRMSNKMVGNPDDYLTGKAHPSVFNGGQLQPEKMVTMAHEMRVDETPPLVNLVVKEEDRPVPGRDYFDIRERERLFDTPNAIARVFRTTAYWRRMVVSAAGSTDLNNRPLQFQWRLLRGDPERVRITPAADGVTAEIQVAWQERRPVQPGDKLESSRADIGVFAHNGKCYSPPSFVTFFFLDNETRVYDAQRRITSIEYKSPAHGGAYVDPAIDLPKDWRDEYHYGAKGELLGWTRVRGEAREEFTFDGALVASRDAQGRPATANPVTYLLHRPKPNDPMELPVLRQEGTAKVVRYRYASAEDLQGSREPEPAVPTAGK